MIRRYDIIEGKPTETQKLEAPVWVCIAPEAEEKKRLLTDFQIDEHTLTSALDPDESSRIEFEPNHAAIVFKYPKNYSAADKFVFKIGSIGFFLFQNRLIVVLPEDVPVFNGKAFAAIDSVSSLMMKLMNRLIYRYMEHLRVINMVSDEIEAHISTSMENKYLLSLFSLEKSLVYYLNAIGSNGFTLEKLKHASAKCGFTQTQQEFLDDILIENNQCFKQAEISSNILASLMDARVSIVSNNLNILMKTLNLITIAIMAPTLVVSIFSMNVNLPFQRWPHSFWFILGLAILSVWGMMFWWKRRKWR
ncbi:MAG: magnesium transporter CorA family protein [Elusimicrobia bacterium]|nr:magnesium transporter CorA family protein [Candidatus Obscuribacterium magneticum]